MKSSSKGWVMVGIFLIIIIALIAAIIYERITLRRPPCNGEISAICGLKVLVSCEAVWYQGDADGNGKKDYWTYDVSCFHRMYRFDGITKVMAIDLAFAKADGRPTDRVGGTSPFGNPTIEDWTAISPTLGPKYGYYFQAMLRDENGQAYNQNEVGTNKIKATNDSKFAFVAYPDVYGTTGIRTYIVNQTGTIYAVDTGSDDKKIILQWPGPDPIKSGWHIVE